MAGTAAPPAEQEQTERAARLRAVIGKLGRRLRMTPSGAGLSPTQIAVLFTIVREGPLGLSALAAREGLNPTMLSRVTAGLAQDGLIRRTPDPQDRRAATVQATAAGVRLRERIHRERARALAGQVGRMSEREQRLLWKALPALEELVELLSEEPG